MSRSIDQGLRVSDWREPMAASETGIETFDAALAQLHRLLPAIPETRYLVHSDLLNFNVLVADNRISAVLDWGCALWRFSLRCRLVRLLGTGLSNLARDQLCRGSGEALCGNRAGCHRFSPSGCSAASSTSGWSIRFRVQGSLESACQWCGANARDVDATPECRRICVPHLVSRDYAKGSAVK